MLHVIIPRPAVYSPWFDPHTSPPVRSGAYQIRSLCSASYLHHTFFRFFDAATDAWRHSAHGPRSTVGRTRLRYEWRGLLAADAATEKPTK